MKIKSGPIYAMLLKAEFYGGRYELQITKCNINTQRCTMNSLTLGPSHTSCKNFLLCFQTIRRKFGDKYGLLLFYKAVKLNSETKQFKAEKQLEKKADVE